MNAAAAAAATPPTATDPAPARDRAQDLGEGVLWGNLTHDPELRFTSEGKPVVSLRLAFTQRVQDSRGSWRDTEPEYYDVQCWTRLAEHCAENLQRGDRVIAVGRFRRETYITRSGEERTSVKLIARELGPSMLFRGAHIERGRGGGNGFTPPAQMAPRPAGFTPPAGGDE